MRVAPGCEGGGGGSYDDSSMAMDTSCMDDGAPASALSSRSRRARRSSSGIVELPSGHAVTAAAALRDDRHSPSSMMDGCGDDTVAVGSLTGRLRNGLKVLSRKLVRSLHLSRPSDAPHLDHMYGPARYGQAQHAASADGPQY